MSAIYDREATSFVAVLLTLAPQVEELDLRMFRDRHQDAPSLDPLRSLFGGAIHCPCCNHETDYIKTRFRFDFFNEYYHHDDGLEDDHEAFDAAFDIAYPPYDIRKPLFPLSSRLASVTRLSISGACLELLALGFENLAVLEVDVVRNPSTYSEISSTDMAFQLRKLATLIIRTDWKLHPAGVNNHITAGHYNISELLNVLEMPQISSAVIVSEYHPHIKPPGHLSQLYADSDRLLQCLEPLSNLLEKLEIRVGNYNKAKLRRFRPISSIRNFPHLKKLSVPTQVLVPFHSNDLAALSPPCLATLFPRSLTSLTMTFADACTLHWLQGLFPGVGLSETNLTLLHLQCNATWDDLSTSGDCLSAEDQFVHMPALNFYKEALRKLPVKFSIETPDV